VPLLTASTGVALVALAAAARRRRGRA
jgi:hypothetical protein